MIALPRNVQISAIEQLVVDLGDYLSSEGVVSPGIEIVQAASETMFNLKDTKQMILNLEKAEKQLLEH